MRRRPSCCCMRGSGCVGLWRRFPRRGWRRRPAAACSSIRASATAGPIAVALPRPLDYMQREARERAAAAARRGRASRAASCSATATAPRSPRSTPAACRIIAGARAGADRAAFLRRGRVDLAGIARDRGDATRRPTCARGSRATTRDVDVAFRGWNDAWLDPGLPRPATSPRRSPTSACRCWSCRARPIPTARGAGARRRGGSARARSRRCCCRRAAMRRTRKRRRQCWPPRRLRRAVCSGGVLAMHECISCH